jgi:hypothetical protein
MMTEAQAQEHPAEASAPVQVIDQPLAEGPRSPPIVGGFRRTAWWLAALLALVIIGVGSSPFWARDLTPLLPWSGTTPAAPPEDYAALVARLEAIEKRSPPPSPDIGAINSATSALARRVDQLETARNTDRQTDAAVAAAKTELQRLEERLIAFETKSDARSANDAVRFEKLGQELAEIRNISTDLADRLPAIERRVGAIGSARTNGALLAALLRMREAVEAARPFASEYDAFIASAHDQPDIIAAAQPLAGLAQGGVANSATLSERLGKLSGRIAPATPTPTGSDIGTEAVSWLRSLVTIRRIDAVVQTGQESAMNVAEAALARNDLPGAVSALKTVSGPKSEAIQSWLEIAQQRLAAEAALAHLQELLVARLGVSSETPGGAPSEAPVRSAQPS